MKFAKISAYAFIFAICAIFIKILSQAYLNFFNKTGENQMIIQSRLKAIKLDDSCDLDVSLPKKFFLDDEIEISFQAKCEPEAFKAISRSFANQKAIKKFLKLSNPVKQYPEVEIVESTTHFNVQSVSVRIIRNDKTVVKLKNLSKIE